MSPPRPERQGEAHAEAELSAQDKGAHTPKPGAFDDASPSPREAAQAPVAGGPAAPSPGSRAGRPPKDSARPARAKARSAVFKPGAEIARVSLKRPDPMSSQAQDSPFVKAAARPAPAATASWSVGQNTDGRVRSWTGGKPPFRGGHHDDSLLYESGAGGAGRRGDNGEGCCCCVQ